MEEKVAKAELLIRGYFAEYIPFLHVNYLAEVWKKTFTDSQMANNLNLKKNQLTYTLQEGISH